MKIRNPKQEIRNTFKRSITQTDRQRVLNLKSSNVFRISNFVLRMSLRQTIVKMSTPPSLSATRAAGLQWDPVEQRTGQGRRRKQVRS